MISCGDGYCRDHEPMWLLRSPSGGCLIPLEIYDRCLRVEALQIPARCLCVCGSKVCPLVQVSSPLWPTLTGPSLFFFDFIDISRTGLGSVVPRVYKRERQTYALSQVHYRIVVSRQLPVFFSLLLRQRGPKGSFGPSLSPTSSTGSQTRLAVARCRAIPRRTRVFRATECYVPANPR